MAQHPPRKVSPGSLKYNIIHKQAATETTVIKHTHRHVTGGGRDRRLRAGEAGVSCIIKLWTVFWGWGGGRGHTRSWLLLGKDLLLRWPVFLSINICI